MTNFIATLQYYFLILYWQYALIVGVLIALCSSLLINTCFKTFSFIGDGLFICVAFGQWLWRQFTVYITNFIYHDCYSYCSYFSFKGQGKILK